jgi:hypothetical protein
MVREQFPSEQATAHEPLQLKNRNMLLKNILRKLAIFDHLITRFMGAMREKFSGGSLLGERAGVRADVTCPNHFEF